MLDLVHCVGYASSLVVHSQQTIACVKMDFIELFVDGELSETILYLFLRRFTKINWLPQQDRQIRPNNKLYFPFAFS